MPIATPFKYHRPFPFCPSAVSPGATYDYVGGLTLANVMRVWWNLADFTISTTGTSTVGANTADANGSVNFNPPSRSGTYANVTDWLYGGCSLFEDSGGFVPFSSLPASTRFPGPRACVTSTQPFALTATGYVDLYQTNLITVEFLIRKDPGDASKYALYYRFVIHAGDFNNAVVAFANPNNGSQSLSGAFTTGTWDVFGIDMDWRCYYNTMISGEGLFGSTSEFTY